MKFSLTKNVIDLTNVVETQWEKGILLFRMIGAVNLKDEHGVNKGDDVVPDAD